MPSDLENSFLKTNKTFRAGKMVQHPEQSQKLGTDRPQGSSLDSHIQNKNEKCIQHSVDQDGKQRRHHRPLRVTRSPHHLIEPHINMSNEVTIKDYLHIIAGIRQSVRTGPEKIKDRIQKNQAYRHKQKTDHGIQQKYIPEHRLGTFQILLSHLHRHQCRSSYSHQRAESRRQINKRESHGQTGNSQCPHPVSDKNTVHHIIQRSSGHCYDRRDSITHQ